jgi:hypothetical protein
MRIRFWEKDKNGVAVVFVCVFLVYVIQYYEI